MADVDQLRYQVLQGDCRDRLTELTNHSVDACVTDAPYELDFMGKKWDATGIAFDVEMWREVFRVLKPGGYLLAFGGTRTHHRMTCAIEDAGFEIRDELDWIYGCLSDDTEILTEHGWERYHKSILDSRVLCYQPTTGEFNFAYPTNAFNYINQHTAYRIQSNHTDQLVSRNHRVLVERDGIPIFIPAEACESQENVPFLESVPNVPNSVSCTDQRTSNTKSLLSQGVLSGQAPEGTTLSQNSITLQYLSEIDMEIPVACSSDNGTFLFPTMQRCPPLARVEESCMQKSCNVERSSKTTIERTYDRCCQSSLEGWCNVFQDTRELQGGQIRSVSGRICGNGSEGWLCDGTSTDYGDVTQPSIDSSRSCTSQGPQSSQQCIRQFDVISVQSRAQIVRGTRATIKPVEYHGYVWCVTVPTGAFVARRNGHIFITGNSGFPKSLNVSKAFETRADVKSTDPIEQWKGWGTALRPAREPIVMARKPLMGSVARNIDTYGTGAINIDGCRIETNDNLNGGAYGVAGRADCLPGDCREGKALGLYNPGSRPNDDFVQPAGRWPSNLILGEVAGEEFGDYARFFYVAKPSRKERDAGCESLTLHSAGIVTGGRKEGSAGLNSPRAGAGRTAGGRNFHPTVKPITLMRYLCRLVTPPGGTVLDHFAGSGTTGCGAILEGFHFIGIEREADHIPLIEARLDYWSQHDHTDESETLDPEFAFV